MNTLTTSQSEPILIQNFINLKESHHTKIAYSNAITKLLRFSRGNLSMLTDQDVVGFVNYLKAQNYSTATIRLNIEIASTLFDYLISNGSVRKNPFKMIKKPMANSAPHSTLTSENVLTLFNTFNSPRDQYILSCLFYMGLRVHELVNVRKSDFFVNNGVLMLKIIGKGKKERTIRVSSHYVDSIRAYQATCKSGSDYVLRQSNTMKARGPVSIIGIQKRIKEMSKQSGIKFSAHSGRYTIATNLIDKNVPIIDISILLGHSSTRVTESYIEKMRSTRETSASMLVNY
jgi:integrase/recombinase XerD